MIQRASLKKQAANTISRLEAKAENCNHINNDPLVVTTNLYEEKIEAIIGSPYTVCYMSSHEEEEPGTSMTEIEVLVQQYDPKWDIQLALIEIIPVRTSQLTFQQYAATSGRPILDFYINSNGFLVR